MPADQRGQFHDLENPTPIDQPRQGHERDPCRIVGATWLHLALHVQGELLPQKQVLGGELGTRPHRFDREPREIAGETEDCADSSANSGDRPGRRILRKLRTPRP